MWRTMQRLQPLGRSGPRCRTERTPPRCRTCWPAAPRGCCCRRGESPSHEYRGATGTHPTKTRVQTEERRAARRRGILHVYIPIEKISILLSNRESKECFPITVKRAKMGERQVRSEKASGSGLFFFMKRRA